MSARPQRYQPRTEHKGRPNGLQPIINWLPFGIDTVITERMENFAVSITRFGLMFLLPNKRRTWTLQKIAMVYCVCLDWCQLNAKGLVGVPHGSKRGSRKTIYMPMTKNKRCDTEDGDRDFMQGLACLSGVGERWVYCILGFLCVLGLMEHAGYESHLNKDGHTIRISKYRIPEDVRTALFKMSRVPTVWRDRYEKKKAKAEREPVPPRPPLFRADAPAHISEAVNAKAQEINEALKSATERTAAETYDLLRAYGRAMAVPQGP